MEVANWPGLAAILTSRVMLGPVAMSSRVGSALLVQPQVAHVAHYFHDLIEGLLRIHDSEGEPFADRVLIWKIAASQRFIDQDV